MVDHIPWSFSGLMTFEECPFRFLHERLLKTVPYTETPKIRAGKKAHSQLERRLNLGTRLPSTLAHMEDLIVKIEDMKSRGASVFAERKLGFTRDGRCTDYFSGEGIWLRVVADVTIETKRAVKVLDWKNGKSEYAKHEQLEVTNMAMLMSNPSLRKATSKFQFLQKEHVPPEPIELETERGELPDLVEEYTNRADALAAAKNDDHWPKFPGSGCRWCPVKRCEFYEKKG